MTPGFGQASSLDLEKQCIKYVDEHDYLYTYINYEAELPVQTEKFLKTLGSRKTFSSKGFEWFQVTLTKESLCLFMIQLLEKHVTPRMAELFLPYAASTLRWTNLDFFMGKCFPMVPESARKRFMEKEIISIINTNAGEDGWVDLELLSSVL